MKSDIELELERKVDDSWTTPKLLVLAVVTLAIGLGIIYGMASAAAPY